MPSTQPIALPSSSQNDYQMASGSYTGSNGSFNPASYTRHFLGSPISWRAGSFGSRYTGGDLLSIDPTGKLSSDSDSILNALNVFDREGDLCRNYTCCGLHLNDLHALVEHFENVHIVVVDTASNPHAQLQIPFNPQPIATPMPHTLQQSFFPDLSQLQTNLPPPPTQQSYTHDQCPVDPDDMDLEPEYQPPPSANPTARSSPSSGAPSPPDTPISTPSSAYGSHAGFLPHLMPHSYASAPSSTCPSPHLTSISAFDTTTVIRPNAAYHAPSHSLRPNLSAFPPRPNVLIGPDAFNAYAGYSDYSSSMPGTAAPSPPSATDEYHSKSVDPQVNAGVPPALLFSPSGTPSSSRVPSPSDPHYPSPLAHLAQLTTSTSSAPASPTAASPSAPHPPPAPQRASTTLSRPASSLLLSKPFRCPKPNCNKSYKQANGLKYHMTHGSCNFAPPKDYEQVQALLASKRRTTADEDDAAAAAGGELSEHEMREVEREAERRLRPFACGVGECQRRYKNMNGLRYHYAHSGDHGALGLALLASGQHECLGKPGGAGGQSAGGGAGAVGVERKTSGDALGRAVARRAERERERERERGRREGEGGSVPASAQSSRQSSMSRQSTPGLAVGVTGPLAQQQQQQLFAGYAHQQHVQQQQQQQMAYQQQQFAAPQRQQYQVQMAQAQQVYEQQQQQEMAVGYGQMRDGAQVYGAVAVPVQMGMVGGGEYRLGGEMN